MSSIEVGVCRDGRASGQVQWHDDALKKANTNLAELRDGVQYLSLMDTRFREEAFAELGFSPVVSRVYSVAATRGWFSREMIKKYGFMLVDEECAPYECGEFLVMVEILACVKAGHECLPASDFLTLATTSFRVGPECLVGLFTSKEKVHNRLELELEEEKVVVQSCEDFVGKDVVAGASSESGGVDAVVKACVDHYGMYGMNVGIQSMDAMVEQHYVERHVADAYGYEQPGYCYLACFVPAVRPIVVSVLRDYPKLRELLIVYLGAYQRGMVRDGWELVQEDRLYHVRNKEGVTLRNMLAIMISHVKAGRGEENVAGTHTCVQARGMGVSRCDPCEKLAMRVQQVKPVRCGCGDRGALLTECDARYRLSDMDVLAYRSDRRHGSQVGCTYGRLDGVGVSVLKFHGDAKILHFNVDYVAMVFLPCDGVFNIDGVDIVTYDSPVKLLVVNEVTIREASGRDRAVVVRVGTYQDKLRWFLRYARIDVAETGMRAWAGYGSTLAVVRAKVSLTRLGRVVQSSDDEGEIDEMGFLNREIRGAHEYLVSSFGIGVAAVGAGVSVKAGSVRLDIPDGASIFVGTAVQVMLVDCGVGLGLLREAIDAYALDDGGPSSGGFSDAI